MEFIGSHEPILVEFHWDLKVHCGRGIHRIFYSENRLGFTIPNLGSTSIPTRPKKTAWRWRCALVSFPPSRPSLGFLSSSNAKNSPSQVDFPKRWIPNFFCWRHSNFWCWKIARCLVLKSPDLWCSLPPPLPTFLEVETHQAYLILDLVCFMIFVAWCKKSSCLEVSFASKRCGYIWSMMIAW